MSTEALVTMITAWIIIISLAGYFLIKVIRTPQEKGEQKTESVE